MRQGFQRLMDVLPANTQKTKTVTLDRGEFDPALRFPSL